MSVPEFETHSMPYFRHMKYFVCDRKYSWTSVNGWSMLCVTNPPDSLQVEN